MAHCNESSQPDAGGVAPSPLTRAGLRRPPRGVEPTAVFVVIEMAVLFCVSALAMVSIIVSIDDGGVSPRTQQVSGSDHRSLVVGAVRAVASSSAHAGQEAVTKTSVGSVAP